MTTAETRSLADLLGDHPLLPLAWRAATRAGGFLRDERPHALTVDTKSTPTDVVTEMDRTAEALIRDDILGARPDDAILGEEGGERLGHSGVRWTIDPLDGTVNYLLGLPIWGVSIGVEVDGEPTLGVVHAPTFDESFVAVRGAGAWRVQHGVAERMAVRQTSDLSASMVTTGFGYDADVRIAQARVVTDLIGEVRDIRRLGAATLDFCWLARGWVDAYYEQGLKAWDVAAGILIAQEAGATVVGTGDPFGTDYILACSPGIAAELEGRLSTLLGH
jgi:myo-inositol-1(or 4)-monophosphatase